MMKKRKHQTNTKHLVNPNSNSLTQHDRTHAMEPLANMNRKEKRNKSFIGNSLLHLANKWQPEANPKKQTEI